MNRACRLRSPSAAIFLSRRYGPVRPVRPVTAGACGKPTAAGRCNSAVHYMQIDPYLNYTVKTMKTAFNELKPIEGCSFQKYMSENYSSAGAPTGQTLAQVPQLMH